MDKTQITQIASQMSTREDLLALLNRIKQDEIRELGFDTDKFYPFTMKHLLYYLQSQFMYSTVIISLRLKRNQAVSVKLQHHAIRVS